MDFSHLLYVLNVPTFGEWGIITLVVGISLYAGYMLASSLLMKRRERQGLKQAERSRAMADEQRAVALAKRRSELMARYHDEKTVEGILNGHVWEGQSRAALVDSIGNPYHREKMPAGGKIMDLWKYRKDVLGQPELTVYLIDDVVVDVVWRQYDNDDFIRMMEMNDRLDNSDWNLWKDR